MERRRFITLVTAVPVVALVAAACGSDSDGASDAETLPTPAPTEAPTTTDAPAVPDEADVVLEYGVYGGFTTRTFAFQMTPNLYVTSDGRAIGPGPAPAIYPGALVPPMSERPITDEGIDILLAEAEAAGLFADIDYSTDSLIADAGTATLRIVADGEEYLHEAYALGIGGPPGGGDDETPERQALADFLDSLLDLESLVGASELGDPEPFESDGYQFVAEPIADISVFEIEPTVEPWPADTGVVLAESLECVEVDREAVGDLFESANELTFFEEDGVTYQLAVRPVLPGRDC